MKKSNPVALVAKRCTAIVLAAIAGFGNFVHAAPADIVSSAAPEMGSDAPKGSALTGAEASVSSQTGGLQYAYPIAMPPGRGGMVPSLALSYSSQGSIYGGIAAGWSLDVPIIKKDTSKSALASGGMADRDLVHAQLDPRDNDMFVSTLAGGRPLIRVTEPGGAMDGTFRSYRAQNDTSFARYERMTPGAGFRWRMRNSDGTTHNFGDPTRVACIGVSDDFAPLTSSRDPFGNEVVYFYTGTNNGECLLSTISYGRNANANINSDHVTVILRWGPALICTPTVGTMANGTPPVGAQLDYRDGTKRMFGSQKLREIEVQVKGPATGHSRTITLNYQTPGAVDDGVVLPGGGNSATCNGAFTPYRQLTSISETAIINADTSTLVTLPTVSFTYADATLTRTSARPTLNPPSGNSTSAYSAGSRFRENLRKWPTVNRILLDLDGDSRPDQLEIDPAVSNDCKVKWWRNTNAGWVAKPSITLPRLPWSAGAGATKAGEDRCSLNAQLTYVDNGAADLSCYGSREKNGSYLAYRWMDMDGDALPDLVTAIHYDQDQYNPDIGTFPFVAPNCGILPPPSKCIAYLASAIGPGGGEQCGDYGCILNYADYKQAEVGGFSRNTFCPVQNGQISKQCIPGLSHAGSTCGRNLSGGCYSSNGVSITEQECSFTDDPDPNPPSNCDRANKPYEKCGGFPWWVYKNLGNGQLASTASVKIQPQPLESDGADSTLVGQPSGLGYGMADIDGDGMADMLNSPLADSSTDPALAKANSPSQTYLRKAQPSYWQVFTNDGTGQFVTGRPGRYPHLFRTPRNAEINRSSFEAPGGDFLSQTALLTDLNGDGLPDYIATDSAWVNDEYVSSPLKGGFNNGLRIIDFAGSPAVSDIPSVGRANITTEAYLPGHSIASQTITTPWLVNGTRDLWSRLVDTDADGRDDLMMWDANSATYRAYFNLSGVFTAQGAVVPAAIRNSVSTIGQPNSLSETSTWRTRTDLVDFDGDGISEAIDYGTSGSDFAPAQVAGHDPAGRPPRVLYQINNGRGATTTVTYASVSNVMNQDVANGYRMPHAMWVVTNLSTVDVFAGTTTASATTYKDPVFTRDPPSSVYAADRGKWNFRGFREVTTTSPTNAKTLQKYEYGAAGDLLSPDWSGRLVETQVIPAEAPTNVRSISRTKYEARTSFGAAITTYHATEERKYTCADGQIPSACIATPAGFSRTASTLTAFPSAGAPEMWMATNSTMQGAASLGNSSFVDGDRQTASTFTYVSNSLTYRMRPTGSVSSLKVAGVLVPFAKSQTDWDTFLNLPLKQRTFFSDSPTDFAESRTEYNALGQVTKQFKPLFSGVGSTVFTEYIYDAPWSLFPAATINELGHQIDQDYDYGTGAVIATRGPNVRTCPSSCTGPLKEEHNTKVDGIGRPLESWVTLSDDGSLYTLAKITEYKYVDVPTFGTTPVPASMTTYKVVDTVFTAWTGPTAAVGTVATVRSDYDGSGRLTRTVQLANGAAAADAVTSYSYGNDGKLISVATPDPTLNTSAQVTTTYSFDSIGRPTGMRLPDNAVAASRSGVDMAYNGRTSTTTEVVGAAGKPVPLAPGLPVPVASTVSTVDDFGRLITVTERRAETGPGQWATTNYTYSPRNEMATITEPQGIVTTLVLDFAGRRAAITRDGKTWNYTYNKNGNMVSEQVPYPAGALAADYTNLQTYDALDRVATKTVGQRNLIAADQALFGTRAYTYTWDLGGNRVGRLKDVAVYAPSATIASLIIQYNYDALGNRVNTIQNQNIAGFGIVQRLFYQKFTPHFGPRLTYFRDTMPISSTVPGNTETSAQTVYDGRGMPKRLDLVRTGNTTQQMAVQTRNVAGLVTKRRTDQLAATGSMPYIESNWVYDSLGRPLSQTIQKGAGTVQIAKQTLAYFGTGDLKSLVHTLGASNTKTFNFEFDARHQLTRVNAGATVFDGTYSFGDPAVATVTPGNSGRLTRVKLVATTALPGRDVKPREVNYVYGTGGAAGVDKEAVTALTNVVGGANYASYGYDAAGNQTSRTYTAGNERWDYVYDGEDNLRRVTKQVASVVSGSEEYWYDESGARIAIVYRNAAGVKTGLRRFIGGTEAYYKAEGVGNNTATLSNVYSHPTLGTTVARVNRTSNTATSVEYRFHGLGSNTLAAVASDGVVNASFVYAPYGEVVEATDGGASAVPMAVGKDAHRRRVTDKYTDEIGGLMYYGARYYDGVMLGWTQSDPLYRFSPDAAWVEPRKGNLYQYVLGNPVRYVDPDGRSAAAGAIVGSTVGGPIGAVVGAVTAVALGYMAAKVLPPSTIKAAASAIWAPLSITGLAATISTQHVKDTTNNAPRPTTGTTSSAPPPPPPPGKGPTDPELIKAAVIAGAVLGITGGKTGNGPAPNGGTGKPHGNAKHDGMINAKVDQLKNDPTVSNIRKNQTQVDASGNRVGNNRPDVQYDQDGVHHCIEYDTVQPNGPKHANVISTNDPKAVVQLEVVR